MAEVPIDLPTGRVIGRFIFEVRDNNDPNEVPQLIPVVGDITIKSSIDHLTIFDQTLGKFVTIRGPHEGVLDIDGQLCTTDPDTGLPMYQGMSLWSNDSDKLSVKGWTYTATFDLQTVDGRKLNLQPVTFTLGTDQEYDLADGLRVPSTPGYGLPQAEAAALRAEGYARKSADSSRVAEENSTIIIEMTESGYLSQASLSEKIVELSGPVVEAKVAPVLEAANDAASAAQDAASAAQDVVTRANNGDFDGLPGSPTAFELRGTGSPLGVVAAPPGTYYTDTVGTLGAWRWLKTTGTGTSGWVVTVGDTGVRDISTMLGDGWGVGNGGAASIRRTTDRIELRLEQLSGIDATGGYPFTLPAGWRSVGRRLTWRHSGGTLMSLSDGYILSGTRVYAGSAATGKNTVTLISDTFNPADPWPTSLPGTPV